jgi:hypothetical protein
MASPLKLDVNAPVVVALTRPGPGKEVESKFGGAQVFYTVDTADGERALYAAAELAQRIDALNLSAGEKFEICKVVEQKGSRTVREWRAQRIQQPAPAARKPAPARVQSMPAPSVAEEIASGIHPAAQGVLSALMTVCVQASIDAWKAGQQYAASQGVLLPFESANVQATANTIFIHLSRDGQVLLPRIHAQGGSTWRQ